MWTIKINYISFTITLLPLVCVFWQLRRWSFWKKLHDTVYKGHASLYVWNVVIKQFSKRVRVINQSLSGRKRRDYVILPTFKMRGLQSKTGLPTGPSYALKSRWKYFFCNFSFHRLWMWTTVSLVGWVVRRTVGVWAITY